jgi:uncharacterized protein (DUF885 family)
MLNRRDVLLAGTAFCAAPPSAFAQPAPSRSDRLAALLDAFFQEQLQREPEQATELGLDKGANAPLKRRLGDVSAAGIEADRRAIADRRRRLAAIDRGALRGADAVSWDTIAYVDEATARVLALDIGGTDGFSPSCYVLSPITGAYQRVPSFLDTKHVIDTADDAAAYVARLDAFAGAIDDNTERLRHDVAIGVVPPDFLLDTTLSQLQALRAPASQSGLVQSLVRRARAKGLDDRFGHDGERIYEDRIVPALSRQIEALRRVRAGAGHMPGISRFPRGAEFYAANLHYTTTTNMTPAEVHQLGLDEARDIGARLDVLLQAQGLTKGTLGARIAALYRDPALSFPDTPAGKAQLLAYLQGRLAEIKTRLPPLFSHIPRQQVEVRAVPAEIDAGAPGAYSEPPSLDGSRPGIVYFNLHDTADWPRPALATTLYHEGLPGHQLQMGFSLESADLPLLRRQLYLSAYGEGWALYAEQLADEIGMYENDPLGRIGFLKAQIFRAGRCIVDTGMHAMGWSREQAVATLGDLTGETVGYTTREVDRYCAIPAQACSYKIGHTWWLRERAKARAALGARFDIRAFHDAGLDAGAMPLDVLAAVVDGYIRRAGA